MPTFQDNFGRPDGNNVDSGWNNPGAVFPNFDIFGAALRVRGGIGAIVLVWDVLAPSFIVNQFSQATIIDFGAPEGTQAGLCIRSSVGSGGKGLGYFFDRLNAGTLWELVVVDPVGSTQLGTVPDTFVAGDLLKIDCVGTTVRAWHNGAVVISGVDPLRMGGVPHGGRVGFYDLTGQNVDVIRWGGWTGGWSDLKGGKIMRLRR